MRIPNPDDPWEGIDEAPRIATAQQQSFAEVHEKAAQALAKQHAGKSPEEIRREFPGKLGERMIVIAQSQAPTRQQIMAKRQKAVREANSECWIALKAQGFESQQHAENDFVRVIVKLLDMQLNGVTKSISALLREVFPDAPEKAKSIRGSNRCERWKAAYNSDAVQNHPVEVAMRAIYGRVGMKQRGSAASFGASLGIHLALFKGCDMITKYGAERDQLKARVQLLEQQMQETKVRQSLDDAGCTTSRDKVLALRDQGKGPTAIASELGMNRDTVKSIIRRSKVG